MQEGQTAADQRVAAVEAACSARVARLNKQLQTLQQDVDVKSAYSTSKLAAQVFCCCYCFCLHCLIKVCVNVHASQLCTCATCCFDATSGHASWYAPCAIKGKKCLAVLEAKSDISKGYVVDMSGFPNITQGMLTNYLEVLFAMQARSSVCICQNASMYCIGPE